MSIVVTGGAGFVGSHLVTRLHANRAAFAEGDEPIVVIDNFHRSSADALRDLVTTGAVQLIEADIRDDAALACAMRGASYVFHLAAQSNVMGAEADPEYAYSTNVTGTYRVLRAASDAGAGRIVMTSSREVYGQPATLPVPESTVLAPKNTYGATKAAAEMLARVAAARGGLEVVALRLANVYGPGDTGRVIPIWLERAARGEDLIVYGGRQVMDLIWVDDVVSALIRAALAPQSIYASVGAAAASDSGFFAAVNVGTGQGTPLSALSERIRALFGGNASVRIAPARDAEVEQYITDTTLMRSVLGLRPDPPLAHLHALAEEARLRAPATLTPASRRPYVSAVTGESV